MEVFRFLRRSPKHLGRYSSFQEDFYLHMALLSSSLCQSGCHPCLTLHHEIHLIINSDQTIGTICFYFYQQQQQQLFHFAWYKEYYTAKINLNYSFSKSREMFGCLGLNVTRARIGRTWFKLVAHNNISFFFLRHCFSLQLLGSILY